MGASDRAYKKCATPVRGRGAAAVPRSVTAMHAVARQTPTIEDLAKLAEGMQKSLAEVSKTMADADTRMRRLKSLEAGTSAILTDASRIASDTAHTALQNRKGLLAIARAKKHINSTFSAISNSSTQIQNMLKDIAGRSSGGNGSVSLSSLEPNVTSVEKQLNELNDPATQKKLDDLVSVYKTFQDGVSSQVKNVLRTNLRGLVDTQREALYNY